MKAVKIILGLVIAIIAIVALVAVLALQNINQLVKTAVETVGPDVVGTEVRLAEVDIKLQDGRGTLKGLTVANPAGYSQPLAFSLGEVALDIDPASLTKDVYVIDEVLVSSADLFAEYKDLSNNNLQALVDNMGGESSEQATSNTEASADSGSDVLLAVKKFTFENSSIDVSTAEWGQRTVNLPAIRLTNLGTADKGLTPEQLTEKVMSQLLDQVKDAVSDDLKALAKEKAEEELKSKLEEKLGEGGKEKLDSLKSLFGR